MTPMMTAFDVSLIFGVSVKTIRNIYRAGRLPYHRVGRLVKFAPADIAIYLERYRVNGAVNGR